MATRSINTSIILTHSLLIFTAPKIFLKTNLEKEKKKTFFGCSLIREDSRTMNNEFQNVKAAKVLLFLAKFKNKQNQHFNICLRSALEANSSQLMFKMPVMQCFVEALYLYCAEARGLYFPAKTEPKSLHYSNIKGHSIQDSNGLKFPTSEDYLKVGK